MGRTRTRTLRPRGAGWLAAAAFVLVATAPRPAATQQSAELPEEPANSVAQAAPAPQATAEEGFAQAPPDADARAVAKPAPSAARKAGASSSPNQTHAPPMVGPAQYDLQPPAAGNEKTGASSQAISVPKGAGTISGMGESFSAQLSTGIATLALPFSIPSARGGGQPALQLVYGSSGGHGAAGIGWDLPVAFIARQVDRGPPRYADPAVGGDWHPGQDRFVFGGGQELVPICRIEAGGACTGARPGEAMPAGYEGWQYFRSRVEGAFQRFFWSPDHRTWVVQTKEGITTELGVPLDGSDYDGALETAPSDAAKIFRWNVVRVHDTAIDAAGSPVNLVQYRYLPGGDGGLAYLTDVFYTPPRVDAASAALGTYAHHVHLAWGPRSDPSTSFRRGWATSSGLRVERVDVASKPFSSGLGVFAPRELVRRYHLGYEASHASLLSTVTLEGRCAAPVVEDLGGTLPAVTGCPEMPAPVSFGYQHVDPFAIDGSPSTPDLPGFEGFDDRVHTIASSPDRSLDGTTTDLFDLDGDALPDVLATLPAFYQGKHGAFFNAPSGVAGAFGPATPFPVFGVNNANAATIALDNPNVSAQDVDGDGRVDLLHMPKTKTYAVYGVQAGSWVGRAITTAAAQSPKVDFTNEAPDIRVMDVDGDGLVDVVYTAATEVQTFLSLGRYPGGDGQFGHATWTGPASAELSNDPLVACAPWSATPIRFSDPDVRIADMNGDGLADIVRLRKGDVRYWPGRGNGLWGTGAADDCPGGTFGTGRHVAMATSPMFSDLDDLPRLDDVNGDGLADLVQIRFNAVDIWLNVDGSGWTEDRHVIQGTPPNPPIGNRVRLADIDGSGTRDILWGQGLSYKYIELSGGKRPWVLTHFANGLGKTLDLEYQPSTALMLADQAAGVPWTSKAPIVVHVVTKSIVSDNLPVAAGPGEYVTEYHYRDPVFDGRQREFRGFRQADQTSVGDANSPTSTTRSTFLLGDCVVEPGQPPDACDLAERWRDNPREALKGRPRTVEAFDEAGVYLSTSHTTYRLRRLYVGRDGREVRDVVVSASDEWLYDTGAFVPAVSTIASIDVELDLACGAAQPEPSVDVILRSTAGRVRRRSVASVDCFGNPLAQTALGCVEGCAPADEPITQTSVPQRPAGDASGWLWRVVEAWVTGADPLAKRNHTFADFDPQGRPTDTSAELAGTLPLDRFHEDPAKAVAPTPAEASTDGVIALGHVEYDELGNAVAATGPNGRCRASSYDDAYAELTVSETVYAGPVAGACGSVELTKTAVYDRGLGQPTMVFGVGGELTTVERDGFGRTKKIFRPHGELPLTPSAEPSQITDYFLTADPVAQPYSLMRVRTLVGADDEDPTYRETWTYVDGLGRTLLTLEQADPTAGDEQPWIAAGLDEYDAKGAAKKGCLPWFSAADPELFDVGSPPPTDCRRQRYDAFGRPLQKFELDGAVVTQLVHHALSHEAWDAADLGMGSAHATPTLARRDGHGRTVVVTEQIHVGGVLEQREVRTTYLPTGEPRVIERVRVGKPDAPVVRWMRYDSLGRLLLNVEPDTSVGFSPDPTTDPATIKAWRYRYDDAGDVVGTSDARGCGVNNHYDAAGRPIAQDFSPCRSSHADYTPPDLQTGAGTEVYQRYDTPDADGPPVDPSLCPSLNPIFMRGRLAATSDRGSKVVSAYDGRGRGRCVAKRVAKPGVPSTDLSLRYAPTWYRARVDFDGADRPVVESTGSAVTELLGAGQSAVTTSYSLRGTVRSLGSSHGALVASTTKAADGKLTAIVLGDLAQTTTTFTYDQRRRLDTRQTFRAAPAAWSASPAPYAPAPDPLGPPSTLQLLLDDTETTYDAVDNPVEIHDWRSAADWPAGAKPASRVLAYDDLYRLTHIDYLQSGGADAWVSPFAPENGAATCTQSSQCQAGEECVGGQCLDRRQARPAPHVIFPQRVQAQTFAYDWLGNTSSTSDDAAGFYDRSLGAIQNGTATAGPYRLTAASNESPPPADPSRTGHLTAAYDAAGNLVSLAVQRNGTCLPDDALCSHRYVYDWDEVGRLARARRWDLASAGAATDPTPAAPPDADLRFAYDAANGRVLKTAQGAGGAERHTVYVFDSLELRRAPWDGTDYERSKWTEAPYLVAAGVRLARIVYEEAAVPSFPGSKLHVLIDLLDSLGSTGVVIDRATGELVEHDTYQAYGAAESSYRPGRWDGMREDYRFTGKEDDVEVGLMYFGQRYYAPMLGRWVSADPAGIHELEADLNLYAYVDGRTLLEVDPDGRNPVVIGILVGAAVGGAWAGANYALNVQIGTESWDGLGAAMATGAAAGATMGGVGAYAAPLIGNVAAAGFAGWFGGGAGYLAGEGFGALEQRRKFQVDGRALLASAAIGAAVGVVTATVFARFDGSRADYPQGMKGKWGRGAPPPQEEPPVAARPRPAATTEPPGCFAAETLVLTSSGYVEIGDVTIGEQVWAFDNEAGSWGWATVGAVIVHEHSGPLVQIGSSEERILATPNHPVCVIAASAGDERAVPEDIGDDVLACGGRGRWVRAGDLRVGDTGLGADGPVRLDIGGPAAGTQTGLVYNLRVDGARTYAVGAAGLLVHNKAAAFRPPSGRVWVPSASRFRDPATGRFVSPPEFPGQDPTRAPPGFEWRGKPGSLPGGREGAYYNPTSRESLHPDLNHPPPTAPHWDYRDSGGKWWRIFADGHLEPK